MLIPVSRHPASRARTMPALFWFTSCLHSITGSEVWPIMQKKKKRRRKRKKKLTKSDGNKGPITEQVFRFETCVSTRCFSNKETVTTIDTKRMELQDQFFVFKRFNTMLWQIRSVNLRYIIWYSLWADKSFFIAHLCNKGRLKNRAGGWWWWWWWWYGWWMMFGISELFVRYRNATVCLLG